MRFIVTSDVHLGSNYCRVNLFTDFVQSLKDDVCLVLAGDTIDAPGQPLNHHETRILNGLIERSEKSRVVWIEGNHDDGYRPERSSKIEFARDLNIGQHAFVTHGDRFDNIMPRNRWFIAMFRLLHWIRLNLGAQPVHVAHYAKRFKRLYNFLCKHVRDNALEHARETDVKTVVCGHVHFPESIKTKGIHYINLGTWTEDVPHCVLINNGSVRFLPVTEAIQDRIWFYPHDSLSQQNPAAGQACKIAV